LDYQEIEFQKDIYIHSLLLIKQFLDQEIININ